MENTRAKLAYKEEGASKLIILLHGFCGSKEYWKEVIPYLKDTYKVIAVDVRGHGETETTTVGYGIHDMAEDLYKFFKEHDLKDAYIFGHSMGDILPLILLNTILNLSKGMDSYTLQRCLILRKQRIIGPQVFLK